MSFLPPKYRHQRTEGITKPYIKIVYVYGGPTTNELHLIHQSNRERLSKKADILTWLIFLKELWWESQIYLEMTRHNKPPAFWRSRPFSVSTAASDAGSSGAYRSAEPLFLLPTRWSPACTTNEYRHPSRLITNKMHNSNTRTQQPQICCLSLTSLHFWSYYWLGLVQQKEAFYSRYTGQPVLASTPS